MGQTVGVQLLGSTALTVDGQLVELGSVRQRRLLAALALDIGAVVSADRLADRVWADGDLPDDPRRALRTNLARLRQAIGDVEAIATEPSGWRLDDAQVVLDTRRFDELVSAAAEPGIDVHGRLARLDEALALWRGGAYEDMAGEDWVRAESTRLEELKLTAVERRYDAMLAAGMHTDALPGLAGEVDANPLRDRLVGLQMLALYRSGRQAEATRAYEQHRRHLADELGLEPGVKLHELDSRIVAGDPSLHLTSTAGTPLRSYRLGEQLGEGAFAVVYRGTQPSVGRDVAIKVIRADLANRPEFVRRFEAEAHLVARLEHPYIVPLYDYWREPDRACLVLRYLRGGTLEARLTSGGPLSLDACATMVEQIGSALAAAHAEGVVHRDVKPANVFLDEVGNFYLGDFGIALEATEVSDPTAALSAGSPAYASPEQLRREPVGPPADVHGLAISIYESLTGRLPFPAAASQAELLQHQLHDPIPDVRERRGEVPAAVDAVIQRATAKLPAGRYQTVEELMAEFKAALQADQVSAVVKPGSATVITAAEARNPYKGLRAFTEADSGDFHGRERLVDRLLALMSQTGTAGRIAAVVGPSGIGKSSVVRAGLLPALRQGQVPTSERWFVATMLPGSNPFDELAAALLRVATHAPDNMMGMLTDDRRGIARVVKALVPDDDGSDVLLVIDQFEELFTLTAQADTVRFLDALEHAVTDTRCPLRVVLTMRADFWDRPLRHGAFARLIDGSTVNVTALAPDELERAIVAPAHHFGVEFEPGLVSEIVADVNDQPGALPLLQYALTELWERRAAGVLTREAYRDLGGVTGALARRAEELYVESTPDEQHATRRLIGRLVTLGEGTEDVRRRAVRNEVGDDAATASVIDRFGQARLLSFDHDPTTREPTIEVAHEALIREWPRLRGWLDEDRDGLRVHRHLTDTAHAWLVSERDHGELYRGTRLGSAEMWAEDHRSDLNAAEREFLDASVSQHAVEEASERERLDEQIRSNRRLRVLVTTATVIAVIAGVAGAFAFQQRSRADAEAEDADQRATEAEVERERADANAEEAQQQARDAADARADAEQIAFDRETDRLVATAQSLAVTRPREAMLLAVAAYEREASAETLGGLQAVLGQAGPVVGYLGYGTPYLDVESMGDDVAVGIRPDGLDLFDVRQRQLIDSIDLEVRVPPGPEALQIRTGSAGGGLLAVGGRGSMWVLDVTDRFEILFEHVVDGDISSVSVAPNGGLVVVATHDGWITALARDGTPLFKRELDLAPNVAQQYANRFDRPLWPPNSIWDDPLPPIPLAVAHDNHIHVQLGPETSVLDLRGDISAGPTFLAIEIDDGSILPAFVHEFFHDGTDLVVAGPYGVGRIDPSLGDALTPVVLLADTWGAGRPEPNVHTLVDGAVVSILDSGVLVRFDESTGEPERAVDLRVGRVTAGATLGGGATIALATPTGIALASLDGSGPIWSSIPRLADVTQFSLSQDGRFLVMGAGGASGPGHVFGRASDGRYAELLDLRVDGSVYTAAPPDPADLLHVWPSEALPRLLELDGERPEVFADVALIGGSTGDIDAGQRWYATGSQQPPPGAVYIQDLTTGDLIQEFDAPSPNQFATGTRFDPDGDRLLVSVANGASQLYDTATWTPLEGHVEGLDIAIGYWNTDGSLIATASSTGQISIRDGETFKLVRDMVGPLGIDNSWGDGALLFSEDDSLLLTNHDRSARLWDVATAKQIGIDIPTAQSTNSGINLGTELQLVTATDDDVRVWNLDMEAWPEIACLTASSNLSRAEWEQWGPIDEPYRAICDQFSFEG